MSRNVLIPDALAMMDAIVRTGSFAAAGCGLLHEGRRLRLGNGVLGGTREALVSGQTNLANHAGLRQAGL